MYWRRTIRCVVWSCRSVLIAPTLFSLPPLSSLSLSLSLSPLLHRECPEGLLTDFQSLVDCQYNPLSPFSLSLSLSLSGRAKGRPGVRVRVRVMCLPAPIRRRSLRTYERGLSQIGGPPVDPP